MPRLIIPLALVTVVMTTAVASRSSSGVSLLEALKKQDPVGFERAARAASAGELAALLGTGSRSDMIAAALAAPFAGDAPRLLASFANAAYSPDRSVALAAAKAAIAIVRELDSVRLASLEIRRDLLGAGLVTWHALARDRERWADLRVLALEVSSVLAGLLSDKAAAPIIELIADVDPEVRAAAFELLPSPLPRAHAERVGKSVADDDSQRVALLAAVSLCSGLAFGDLSDTTTALGPAGRRRLESLVLDKALQAPLRLEAAECLPAMGATNTLAKLGRTMPPALVAAARKLAAKAK